MTTPAQQKNKVDAAQTNIQAIQSTPVLQNQGAVVPPHYQYDYVKNSIGDNPTITPPTEENIHKNMFIGSGMVGLMAALATGNPAAGLVAGMWGAVAIHDHGYDLRQRSTYVNELQDKGYSFPAILSWYKTGDYKDLDKEYNQMEQDKRADKREALQDKQFNERMDQSDRRAQESESRFERSQAGMESRFERGLEVQEKRMERAENSASKSGFTQMAMQHRQALMNAAKQDSDQFKAMQRSQAAADKAVADAKLGSPIALQQLLLMGQLIDAPNASVKLSQLHHISEGAAHGVVDRAIQTANKMASGEPVTKQQVDELLQVIAAGHQAQTDTYYKQVGRQAKRYKDDLSAAQSALDKDPNNADAQQRGQMASQDYEDFASAAGLNPQELDYAVRLYAASPKVMDEHHDIQSFDDAYNQQSSGSNSNEVTWK